MDEDVMEATEIAALDSNKNCSDASGIKLSPFCVKV